MVTCKACLKSTWGMFISNFDFHLRIRFSQTQVNISYGVDGWWSAPTSMQYVNILFPFCFVPEQKTASIVQSVAWLTVIFIFFFSWHPFNFIKPPSGNFLVQLRPTSPMTHELIQGREQWSVGVILVVWLRHSKNVCHCAIASWRAKNISEIQTLKLKEFE